MYVRGTEALHYFSYNPQIRSWEVHGKALVAVKWEKGHGPDTLSETELAERCFHVQRVQKLGPADKWANLPQGVVSLLQYDPRAMLGLNRKFEMLPKVQAYLAEFYSHRKSLLSVQYQRRFSR